MHKFKRNRLTLALVAAIGSAGIAGTTSAAVHLSDDGQGQVLIYPYYTTRAGNDTYLSVLNTTALSKALKIRFLEGKNGRAVVYFNIYLSPYDIWTAAVVNTPDGAKLVTADKSCTAPAIPAGGKDFTNFAYSGAAFEGIQQSGGDGETTSLDRTREGYFEIIEMGTITNTAINAAITHASGVPTNCAVVQAATMDMGPASELIVGGQSARAFKATGGLSGTASLINVAGGIDYGYAPVVLEGFFPQAVENIWFAGQHDLPDLSFADLTSLVHYKGSVVSSTWYAGEDSVGALLMHEKIINEYVLDSATLSGTDWVITMPTKRYDVPVHNPSVVTDHTQLFSPFTRKFWLGGACERFQYRFTNRENYSISFVGFTGEDGSVPLCWTSTVVGFSKTPGLAVNNSLLGSTNKTELGSYLENGENGWLKMSFNETDISVVNDQIDGNGFRHGSATQSLTSINGDTYFGLPTVGFMVQDFINQNAAPGILATYGGNFNHKYTTGISRLPQ
ncbi:MAG: hypothetical protein DID91_2727704212 [Candidatus Nitrotoga sp. MKT]|nr:MAG: hypothetical protein DID91_2727704212 [Candidatus Nitrotoga sp. MKT]